MKNSQRSSQSALRWRRAGICLALAAVTLAVFGQTAWHQFINFDDDEYVANNPVVTQGLTFQGVAWAFTHFHAANWHPLTWLSHMLDCELYGLQPGGHHLTSVLLHTGAVIALFLALQRMTGALWRSAFVAAVFAIHPLRVESVAWVAERKDALSGVFFMLTLWAYVRYVEKSAALPSASTLQRFTLHASHYYLLGLLCFALGLMSKPMLVTVPLVLLLLDYWPLQRFNASPRHPMSGFTLQGSIMEKIPFILLSAASCVVTLFAQRHAIKLDELLPLRERLGEALLSCRVYLVQMVYPAKLAAFYPFPHRISGWDAMMAAALLAVISAFAWGERRTRPWLLTGWLWYLVMLLPVVGIIQVGGQAHADRYTYLPQIGLYVAVTWLAADLAAKWRVGPMALGSLMSAIIAILIVCAWKQAAYWKNSETLWRHALACTTDNPVALLNLGHELYTNGRLEETEALYQKALQEEPDNAQFHNNLANALRESGQTNEAVGEYEKAVQINPHLAEAQFNLGKALSLAGRQDEAIPRFEAVLQIDPGFLPAHISLGNALLQRGQPAQAATHFQSVLKIRPNDAGMHQNLGLCWFQMGRMEEAKSEYEQALQLQPNDPGIQNNLAWLLAAGPAASLRDGSRAVELASQASALTGGDNPIVLHTLAAAFAEAGRFSDAVETAQRAAQLAEAQANPSLAKQLQVELDRYRAGKSFPYPEKTQ